MDLLPPIAKEEARLEQLNVLSQDAAEAATTKINNETNENANVQDGSGDTTAEWTMLSEAMAEHDEQLIQDWKDDLNNLLVFAGLFSGVVAGFALEAYGWLQQDTTSQDVTNQLLAQISSQLASFSVSQGFVNSTVVPIPLTTLNASPGPSEQDVRTNVLWFLSLATSLTASLLSIMVQQWLREYRLPKHVPIRERIRLRQYRYEALHDWWVPQIVSILPILLQVALVLFLVGICYLLASLDETVAKAFIASVGIGMSAYFCFTVMPIAFRRCPYKNPFARGVMWTARLISGIALLGIFIVGAAFLIFLIGVADLWKGLSGVKETPWKVKVYRAIFGITTLVPKILNSRFELSGHQYWISRDLDDMHSAKHLDRNALVWAPSALARSDLERMEKCLGELTVDERMVCVCAWVSQALNLGETDLNDSAEETSSPFDAIVFEKIDNTFSNHFRHLLLDVMPDALVYVEDKEFYASGVLVLLRHIARLKSADAGWTIAYAHRLLKIRGAQTNENLQFSSGSSWTRLPTACLYELGLMDLYSFSAEEVSDLCDHAIQSYDALNGQGDEEVFFISWLDLILGSYATALHALSRQPGLLENESMRAKFRLLLQKVDRTVVTHAGKIHQQATYNPHYFRDGVLLISIPASNTLCKSLVSLAQTADLPLDDISLEDPLTVSTLVEHLIETFKGPPYEEGLKALLDYKHTSQRVSIPTYTGQDTEQEPRLDDGASVAPQATSDGEAGKVVTPEEGRSVVAVPIGEVMSLKPKGYEDSDTDTDGRADAKMNNEATCLLADPSPDN